MRRGSRALRPRRRASPPAGAASGNVYGLPACACGPYGCMEVWMETHEMYGLHTVKVQRLRLQRGRGPRTGSVLQAIVNFPSELCGRSSGTFYLAPSSVCVAPPASSAARRAVHADPCLTSLMLRACLPRGVKEKRFQKTTETSQRIDTPIF